MWISGLSPTALFICAVLLFVFVLFVFVLAGRSILAVAIALILSGSAFAILLEPAALPQLLALALALLAVCASFSGIILTQRSRTMQAELETLKGQVTALETLETRRFMKDLKAGPLSDSEARL